MKMSSILLISLVLILLSSNAIAVEIDRPSWIKNMEAEILQTGNITVDGNIKKAILNVYIPQDDDFQDVVIEEVSHDNYEFVIDDYGNTFMRIIINDPVIPINYFIKSKVSVRRYETQKSDGENFYLEPTELIESNDPKIINLAEDIVLGEGNYFDKVAGLAGWVNDNIEYNIEYAEVNNSATKTLEIGEGVCSEYSTLFQALVQSTGIKSRSAVGWVFSKSETSYYKKDDFQPHSWTEVYTGGKFIPVDPTWGEVGKVDATHIKFAVLPDNIFRESSVEVSAIGPIENLKIGSDTEINVLSTEEEPMITMSSKALNDEVWNGHVIVKTDLSTDDCILTKIKSLSCLRENGDFFKPMKEEELIYFCGQRSYFSIYEIPDDLERGTKYTCPVIISSDMGGENIVMVNLSQIYEKDVNVTLSLSEDVALPGQTIIATSPGAFLFTDDGMESVDFLEIKAGDESFNVYAYDEGSLVSKYVEVTKVKPFSVDVSVNASVKEGYPYSVVVSIENKLNQNQIFSIVLKNETTELELGSKETGSTEINFYPSSKDRVVQVFVTADDFTSSASKNVVVIPREKDILEIVIGIINDFLSKLNMFF